VRRVDIATASGSYSMPAVVVAQAITAPPASTMNSRRFIFDLSPEQRKRLQE
jgi:hypothetical protein